MSLILNRCIYIAIISLIVIGLCFSVSTSFWADESGQSYSMLWKQIIFLILGMVAGVVIYHIPDRFFNQFAIPIFVLGIIGVALCYIPGIGKSANGAQRWILLPGNLTIQTSEFAKITTIFALASWFKYHTSKVKHPLQGFLYPSLIIGLPFVVIFLQTDMGTAIALGFIGLCMMFVGGTSLKWLIPTMIVGVISVVLIVNTNENRMGRIQDWRALDSTDSSVRTELLRGEGRQQVLARDGMLSGGLWGVGYAKGADNKQEDLTFAHTDFVFAIICEEIGFLGALCLICLYGMLAVCGLLIVAYAPQVYDRLIATGALSMILIPSIINMMVVTGILPNTGLPLPFISYGGSSLISSLIAVALLLKAGKRTLSFGSSSTYQRRINLPLSAQH